MKKRTQVRNLTEFLYNFRNLRLYEHSAISSVNIASAISSHLRSVVIIIDPQLYKIRQWIEQFLGSLTLGISNIDQLEIFSIMFWRYPPPTSKSTYISELNSSYFKVSELFEVLKTQEHLQKLDINFPIEVESKLIIATMRNSARNLVILKLPYGILANSYTELSDLQECLLLSDELRILELDISQLRKNERNIKYFLQIISSLPNLHRFGPHIHWEHKTPTFIRTSPHILNMQIVFPDRKDLNIKEQNTIEESFVLNSKLVELKIISNNNGKGIEGALKGLLTHTSIQKLKLSNEIFEDYDLTSTYNIIKRALFPVRLVSLCINIRKMPADQIFFGALENAKCLMSLKLKQSVLNVEALFQFLKLNENICCLGLYSCIIYAKLTTSTLLEVLEAIGGGGKHRKIEKVALYSNKVIKGDQLLHNFPSLPTHLCIINKHLRKLSFRHPFVDSIQPDTQYSLQNKELNKLEQAIIKGKQLKKLRFENFNLETSITMKIIRGLELNKCLKVLQLSEVGLTSDLLYELGNALLGNYSLKVLNLNDNRRMELSPILVILSALRHNRTLLVLSMKNVFESDEQILMIKLKIFSIKPSALVVFTKFN